ncbi:MAG: hypothetical protein ABI947_04960 [Chloroflexota bacterium]
MTTVYSPATARYTSSRQLVPPFTKAMPNKTTTLTDISRSWAFVLITVLLLSATFIRAYDLTGTPPGLSFDATWNLADGLRISRGIPFPAVFDTRPEPVYRWIVATSFVLLGPHVYSAQVFQVLLGTLTVALTYAAGLALLNGREWRRLGALVAAGAMAANVAHLFLIRNLYRSALLPPVILLIVIVLLRTVHSQRGKPQNRLWTLGGFLGGLGLHTYLAGIMTAPLVAGFAVHQVIFPPRERRANWRVILWTALGLIIPVSAYLIFAALVPDLFFRIHAAGGDTPITLARVVSSFAESIQEFYLVGYKLPLYNTPNSPFLNPVLAVLAMIGFVLAVWRWREADGALFIGGMLLFIAPGALSEDPTHPVRLVGTMPLLALLSGLGSAWVIAVVTTASSRWRAAVNPLRAISVALTLILIASSIGATHIAFRGMFADPAEYNPPEYWLGVPHNYIIAFVEALELLEKVDKPTYTSLAVLDNPTAGYILQREAYPNVTTWARHPLKELPAGQFFFPVREYYHAPTSTEDPRMVLLLPAEKTIVILPVLDNTAHLIEPVSPQTREINDSHGWLIARITPMAARPFTPPQFEDQPVSAGQGLELVGKVTTSDFQPGQVAPVVLYWRVTAPQPADIFSVAQLLDLNLNQHGNSDHHVLPYLYPSARWQPGDIIPDRHTVPIVATLPPGVYRWAAGVHVPPKVKRLIVNPQDSELDDLWLWGSVRLPKPTSEQLPTDAIPLNVRFDDHILLSGYQLARDNNTWTVKLYWRVTAAPQGDYTIFVHVMAGDQMIAQQDAKPLDIQLGQVPTWAWTPGEVITTSYTLSISAGAILPDALYVGMYTYPSLERLSISQDDKINPDRRALIWSESQPK